MLALIAPQTSLAQIPRAFLRYPWAESSKHGPPIVSGGYSYFAGRVYVIDAAVRELNRWVGPSLHLDSVLEVQDSLAYPANVSSDKCVEHVQGHVITLCMSTWISWAVDPNGLPGASWASVGAAPKFEDQIAAYEFILLHETAHVLVGETGVPVVGDEEAAIDELAAVLWLESGFGGDGPRKFFEWLASRQDARMAEWSHHGSAERRLARLVCLQTASDAARLARANVSVPSLDREITDELAQQVGGTDRLLECRREYATAVANWHRLLGARWRR